jgi:hypothetical protein
VTTSRTYEHQFSNANSALSQNYVAFKIKFNRINTCDPLRFDRLPFFPAAVEVEGLAALSPPAAVPLAAKVRTGKAEMEESLPEGPFRASTRLMAW